MDVNKEASEEVNYHSVSDVRKMIDLTLRESNTVAWIREQMGLVRRRRVGERRLRPVTVRRLRCASRNAIPSILRRACRQLLSSEYAQNNPQPMWSFERLSVTVGGMAWVPFFSCGALWVYVVDAKNMRMEQEAI